MHKLSKDLLSKVQAAGRYMKGMYLFHLIQYKTGSEVHDSQKEAAFVFRETKHEVSHRVSWSRTEPHLHQPNFTMCFHTDTL